MKKIDLENAVYWLRVGLLGLGAAALSVAFCHTCEAHAQGIDPDAPSLLLQVRDDLTNEILASRLISLAGAQVAKLSIEGKKCLVLRRVGELEVECKAGEESAEKHYLSCSTGIPHAIAESGDGAFAMTVYASCALGAGEA